MKTAPQFHGPAAQALREAKGIKQADLARTVGCGRATLANIEAGRRQPSVDLAVRIAKALDVPLGAIACGHLVAA